jgi:hypothetical protein
MSEKGWRARRWAERNLEGVRPAVDVIAEEEKGGGREREPNAPQRLARGRRGGA